MKLTIKHKIIATNLMVLILAFIAISLVVVEGLDTMNERMLVDNLVHQADISVISIQQSLLSGRRPGAVEDEFDARAGDYASRLSRESGARVLVFSRFKALLADSEGTEGLQRDFKEMDEVLKGNRTYVIKRYEGSRYMHFAFPVMLSGSVVGEVVLVYPMQSIDENVKNVRLLFLVAFAAGIVVVLTASILLSDRIARPILRLKTSALEIAGGSFSSKIKVVSSDEVGELADAFNRMSHEIENRINLLNLEREKQRQFLTNVSHELRTPLTAILGYIDLLKARGDSKDIFETSVHYLEDAGDRLLRLVNDLIDLSCLNRTEFEIEPKSTDISALVKDITGQMSWKAQKFNIKINTDIAGDLHILADPVRVKQAVVNLLDNAIKYSAGGEISIRLAPLAKGVQLDITDTGCGIPAEVLDKIFEPFYRVDKARSRDMGGNGLGLAITKEIIDKHNGKITMESKEGEGTRVSIVLP